MTTDPMEPSVKLMEAFAKAVEQIGMKVHTFAIIPNPDGPPHGVQAMLLFDGIDLPTTENTPDADAKLTDTEADAFEMLARDFQRSSEEEKAEQAAKGLENLLKSLEDPKKGILGDD